ncbi:MAG TPA: 2'-5' RNA ligase family protein [Flavisolibacter sp.]|nr:2'-5' RNA ligase family protein [Flavisolibacter sp.]
MERDISMAGYRIYEYLLVLNPPEELWKRVQDIRNDFAEKYKTTVASFTKPHITLASFSALGMMEEKIMHRLQVITMGATPFKVELRDYGSFPTHTIFINVVSKLPIQDLVHQLKEAQRLMKLNNENKAHFMDEPHLPVCRKLKPWQYEQGWLEYAHRQFTGRFIADSMLLLKREASTKAQFQIAKRFEFQNLPVTTKQGSLFV